MKTKQVFYQGDLLAKTFEPFMMLCIAVKKKKKQSPWYVAFNRF